MASGWCHHWSAPFLRGKLWSPPGTTDPGSPAPSPGGTVTRRWCWTSERGKKSVAFEARRLNLSVRDLWSSNATPALITAISSWVLLCLPFQRCGKNTDRRTDSSVKLNRNKPHQRYLVSPHLHAHRVYSGQKELRDAAQDLRDSHLLTEQQVREVRSLHVLVQVHVLLDLFDFFIHQLLG